MSTRHLLNMTMGAFALLLLAAGGVFVSTQGDASDQNARIDLAMRQQVLVQELSRHAAALATAEDRATVDSARQGLGQTVMQFDRNLNALLNGGAAAGADEQTIEVGRTRNEAARSALEQGAQLWRETGLPLADLAAGEFSVFSAAGQKAVNGLQGSNVELMQHMGAVANSMRMGLHARRAVAGIAGWAAGALALVLIALGVFRRRLLATESVRDQGARQTATAGANAVPEAAHPSHPLPRRPTVADVPTSGLGAFPSPLSFDSVNASVDQMTVDMNTIAGSTEKMRLAIGTVGNALQGMLYSLNEMAQDTAEGHRIVRNANNAASYTATAAGTLAASAREMAEVVARVTQLAQKTRQIAVQIDADAIQTGKTGESFTSVVAGEVKGLARQTNQATREIEDTVGAILQTARQYEEAIGQIIKNVAAINKVSQNLGELMLDPPPRVQPGMALAAQAQAMPAHAPSPAPAPLVPAADPVATGPVAAEPLAAEPLESEYPAAETETAPAPALQDGWGAGPAAVADDPVEPALTPDEVAAETTEVIAEIAAEEAVESVKSEAHGDVFMLGSRNRKPGVLNIPAPAAKDSGPANVFMLNKPKIAANPVPASAPPVPAEKEPADGTEDAAAAASPKAPAAGTADASAPAAPTTEDQAPVAETVPAGTEAEIGLPGSSANIFMLNKPR